MKVQILVLATVLASFAQAYDSYTVNSRSRQLEGTTSDWDFEQHNDVAKDNYVGSCYRKQYTYYTSFICKTLDGNCINALDYCVTLDDPLDYKNTRPAYLMKIIFPSIFGGGCLICCICTFCCLYFTINGIVQFRERRARQSRKPKRKQT